MVVANFAIYPFTVVTTAVKTGTTRVLREIDNFG